MEITYVYSAGVKIKTVDCRIICDPWWTPAYDGSWVQWPVWARTLDDAVSIYGEADYCFISHTHPDHFDMPFLRAYLAKYPNAKVLIAQHDVDLLGRKLESRGIIPVRGSVIVGKTTLRTVPNMAGTFNIDSALRVSCDGLSVVNLNDNPYDQGQIDELLVNGPPTVALLPFVGAGPWPQCYEFGAPGDAVHWRCTLQMAAAERKKRKYLDLFSRYCQALKPKIAVPFAGQYWLHGDQLNLNNLRGMADATECYPLWKHVWVPSDGGDATLTLENQEEWRISGIRDNPYEWPIVRTEIQHFALSTFEQSIGRYRYEREIQVPVERLPLLKLLQSAVQNAYPQFKDRPALHVFIKTQLPQWFHIITHSQYAGLCGQPWESPRVEVYLDARYLFSMLTRLANANSVRIGSLCRFKVVPAEYDKELDDLFGEYWDSLRV